MRAPEASRTEGRWVLGSPSSRRGRRDPAPTICAQPLGGSFPENRPGSRRRRSAGSEPARRTGPRSAVPRSRAEGSGIGGSGARPRARIIGAQTLRSSLRRTILSRQTPRSSGRSGGYRRSSKQNEAAPAADTASTGKPLGDTLLVLLRRFTAVAYLWRPTFAWTVSGPGRRTNCLQPATMERQCQEGNP